MALVSCPECEKEVSDKAPSCPNCGVVIAKDNALKPPEDFKKSKTEKLSAAVYGFLKFILYLLLVAAIGSPATGLGFILGWTVWINAWDGWAEYFVPVIGILIGTGYAIPIAWRIMYSKPKD